MISRRSVVWAGLLALGVSVACGARSSLSDDLLPQLGGAGGAGAGVAGSLASGGMAGAAAQGGGGAAGVAAAAGSAGSKPCTALIDDMENGSGFILPCPGRSGAWYAYNDGFGVQVPPPTAPGVPVLPRAISGGRGGSSRAMFNSYGLVIQPPVINPSVNWGGGIGVDLNFDGVRYGSYDASAYDGISFWARGSTSNVYVRVSTIATTLASYGGSCLVEFCAPAEATFVSQAQWQQYFFLFSGLFASAPDSHEPLGEAFRKDQLTNLQFLYTQNDFETEFWLDDLAFYSERAR